jgi:hypothetical protein
LGNVARVRILVLIACALLALPACARMGVVRTSDGSVFEGRVRLTRDGITVVNAERGQVLRFDLTNVVRLAFPSNAPSAAITFLEGSLPAGWRDTDIGTGGSAGSTVRERGVFTVRGAGEGIEAERDSFRFVHKAVNGDREIVAEIPSIHQTHPRAKAGLMMREDLGEYARHVTVSFTAARGGVWQVRDSERALATATPFRAAAPGWLKLRRRGDEFTAFTSRNGRVWSQVERVSVPMKTNIHVGLALASGVHGAQNWTTFAQVREAPRLLNEDFMPEVELSSGSVVVGRPVGLAREELSFENARVAPVPLLRVARILYQPFMGSPSWRAAQVRSGVLMANGDFVDGELRGVTSDTLTLSSVLYGLRTMHVADDVLAVVLQPRFSVRRNIEIETVEGSLLVGDEATLGDGEVLLREAALGTLRVPAFEVVELRRR